MSDYLRCPEYFYKKHITRELSPPPTDPMIVGSAVDHYLTRGKESFKEAYEVVSRRTRNETYRYQLTPSMNRKIRAVATAVEKQPAYQGLESHEKQLMLSMDTKIGEFCGLRGILDFCRVSKDKAIITDLKTTSTPLSKYKYKINDFNYPMQMAVYGRLVCANYPKVKDIAYRHLVCHVDPDGIYPCGTFSFSSGTIANADTQLDELLGKISKEKYFLPNLADWNNCEII